MYDIPRKLVEAKWRERTEGERRLKEPFYILCSSLPLSFRFLLHLHSSHYRPSSLFPFKATITWQERLSETLLFLSLHIFWAVSHSSAGSCCLTTTSSCQYTLMNCIFIKGFLFNDTITIPICCILQMKPSILYKLTISISSLIFLSHGIRQHLHDGFWCVDGYCENSKNTWDRVGFKLIVENQATHDL